MGSYPDFGVVVPDALALAISEFNVLTLSGNGEKEGEGKGCGNCKEQSSNGPQVTKGSGPDYVRRL